MWLDKYKVFRRIVLLWSVWLITRTTFSYLDRMGAITSPDAIVITAIIGILTIVIGFQRND